jgi:5-methylcytosine-specific restriction enzyme A
MTYFILEDNGLKEHIKKERLKAQKLKKTNWWHEKIQKGLCEHCQKPLKPREFTMDHLVPLARGGFSSKGNIVASCLPCNRKKQLSTPVDQLLEER